LLIIIPYLEENSCLGMWLSHPGNCHECVLLTSFVDAEKIYQICCMLWDYPEKKDFCYISIFCSCVTLLFVVDEVLGEHLH